MPKSPTFLRGARKTFTVAAGLTLAVTALVPAGTASAKQSSVSVYVSPTGQDANAGTKAAPFKTLARARDYVRTISQQATGDIDVVLADGTYSITDTFTLTGADSGVNGHWITYRAAPGAQPVISGGSQVTGWSVSDPARGIYKAHVGAIDTRQLYVNGELETRARTGDNPPGFSKTATGYSITDTSLRNVKNQSAIEVDSRWGWMQFRCPVQAITANAMTMQQQCWHNANLHEGQEIQTPSWLENAYEFLDTPGEWYLDKSAGDLYYQPKPGQNLATATVTVPRVQNLVDVNGDVGHPVSNVGFGGITF